MRRFPAQTAPTLADVAVVPLQSFEVDAEPCMRKTIENAEYPAYVDTFCGVSAPIDVFGYRFSRFAQY